MIEEYREILIEEIESNLKKIIDSYRKEIIQLKKERDELKIEVEHLKSKGRWTMSETKVKWHKYPDEKPSKSGWFLITRRFSNRKDVAIIYISQKYDTPCNLVAWAELPKPYKEEAT